MPMVAVKQPYILFVVSDDTPQNPRTEQDNLGTMICFCSKYNLGDDHSFHDPDDFQMDLLEEKLGDTEEAEMKIEELTAEIDAALYRNQHGSYRKAVHDNIIQYLSSSFVIEGKSNLLFVCETPIDVMSHVSFAKLYGHDWRLDHRISLGCVSDGSLERYLQWHPEIKKIVFSLDNDYLAKDKDGCYRNWGQLAASKWCDKYSEKGYEIAVHRPHLNDFNQDLIETRKGRTTAELDAMREAELKTEFEKEAVDEPNQEAEIEEDIEP